MAAIACDAKLRGDNTSGMRGVSYDRKRKQYRAYCRWNGKFYSLGWFDDVLDAGAAAYEFRTAHFPAHYEKLSCSRCDEKPVDSLGLCKSCYMKQRRREGHYHG